MDDAFFKCLRQANQRYGRLGNDDNCGSCKCHRARLVENFGLIKKTPSIPHQEETRLGDDVGMGVAVHMFCTPLTAKSWLKGERFVQFNSVRKVCRTFTLALGIVSHGIRGEEHVRCRDWEGTTDGVPHTTEMVWVIFTGDRE